ncbi:MAG TPA: phage portal protein [Spongiibacteraceae bacterium]|nr:phage portal protein [Spongiibacteraceae bacterium]
MANRTLFQAVAAAGARKALMPANGPGGWRTIIREPFAGAWQQNREQSQEDLLAFHAVFACITLIASDISKLGLRLQVEDGNGIWRTEDGSWQSRLIAKPNDYQTTGQFIESWLISKLARGNAYELKERDAGKVVALHALHPDRVKPLVSESGEVFYQLAADRLAGVEDDGQYVVPASEVIHDRFNCLYHPLVGLSPLYAAALAVIQGRQIQSNSTTFFGNNSMPGGILTVPGAISNETAQRLKATWEENHGGLRSGKLAVLGDGMKYESIAMTATDSQLIEQLRWTAEVVCSVYHVPPFKVAMAGLPAGQKAGDLNQIYYNDCLQRLIADIQALLNVGLDIKPGRGFRFDLDSLLMMDKPTQVNTLKEAVGGGFMRPNSAAQKLNQAPVEGGDTFYLQQQNYSVTALARRDSMPDPFSPQGGAPASDVTSAAPAENIQQEALNGAQVTALQGIIFAVANGQLTAETARALIRVAFPLVTDEQIDEMLDGAAESKPPSEAEAPDENPEDAARWLAIFVEKELARAEYA